jgi:hypothetical protein
MGLESQISDLQQSFDGLFKHGGSSTLDKLRWITTPREEALTSTILEGITQSVKQISNSLQHLNKVAGQTKGAAG